jgi:hypothetical protein
MVPGGRQGDDVTTTGGPEHSVTEPVTVEHFDGDDIVVVPDAPPALRRRSRAAVVAAIAAIAIAVGAAVAIAVTGDDEPSTVRSTAPARTEPAPAPSALSAPRDEKPKPPKQVPAQNPPPVSIPPETPVSSPPAVVVPPPVEPPAPPDTTPPVSPSSVLQWSATPAALTIPAGGHKALTVHVVNPSDGTVTLGHPLSCPPTLRGPNGKAVGYAVCVEMAQLLAPHDELTQEYTIYATDTGAAGGAALKPGAYTATIDNRFTVKVTITSS